MLRIVGGPVSLWVKGMLSYFIIIFFLKNCILQCIFLLIFNDKECPIWYLFANKIKLRVLF